METGQEYSSEEISEMCGLKGSRTRQLLKQLVEMGKLKATADTKNRRYIKKRKHDNPRPINVQTGDV